MANDKTTSGYIKLSLDEEVIKEHYQRCKTVILRHCKEGEAFRALIGDHKIWWKTDREKGTAKLFYPDEKDYDALTSKYRTLYWTAQLFRVEIANVEKPYDFEKHRITEQIGGREDTVYHSFFLDLDKAKDKDIHAPGIIEWLEKAIKFFADKLRNAGVESFGLAFSGGGVYCMLHPRLGMIAEDEKDRVYKIESIQRAFDLFIGDVASEFFEKNPEAIEYVKFDKLNYDKKRQVKTLLSIHKKYPYAVIPLDKRNPKIDLGEAGLPISDETIEKAMNWLIYEDDIDNFGDLLKPWIDKAKETIKKKHGTRTVALASEEVSEKEWAPCIRNIIAKKDLRSGAGGTRALSVLASYLRYVGVPEEKAYHIFKRKANEWNAETSNIFNNWYGCEHLDRPKCFVPSCEKIKTKGSGYPHPELGELEICTPDERCKEIRSPIQYHKKKKEKKAEKPLSLIDKIIQLTLDNCELIHDNYNEGFAIVNTGANKKVIKLRSREFKLWVGNMLWDTEEQGINQDALVSALTTLEGKALFDGEKIDLYNRVANYNGKIYYHLRDEAERIIEIDNEGWRFTSNSPVLFRREQHQKAQVEPTKGGDLKQLWNYINLTCEEDRVLFCSCLISMFFSGIDHVIPVWYGDQGSGKTISSECVKDLIDPSSLKTQALSKDEESLILTLYHNWLSVFDNVSEVKDWQSDILSRAITGGGQSRRRRYTDEEEQLYDFRRCFLINGLTIPITAPDVMDRSLLFKIKRFDQHGSKEKLEKEFERNKPRIFGALFDLVSKTLKIKEEQNIEPPPGIRLYDFGIIGEAAARAAGEKEGYFSELFLKKKADDNLEVIQSSLMGSVLYSLIAENSYTEAGHAKYPFIDEKKKWSGTPSELLKIFNLKASEGSIDRRQKGWKGSPRGLSVELDKLKTNFKAVGIEIERGEEHKGRYINILVTDTCPFYNVNLRDIRDNRDADNNGHASHASHAKKPTLLAGYGSDEKEDGENFEVKKVVKKEHPESLVTQNISLDGLIASFVTNASTQDERGAMIEALINRIATGEYEKEDVKNEIDRLLGEGKLIKASQDEYGNDFVKVVESPEPSKKKEKTTRFVNVKEDLDEDGNIINTHNPKAPTEEKI